MKILFVLISLFAANVFAETWVCSATGYASGMPQQIITVLGQPASDKFEAVTNALNACSSQGLMSCQFDNCYQK